MAAAIDSYEGLAGPSPTSPSTASRPEQARPCSRPCPLRFRQSQGADYYSTRLLGHFLLPPAAVA